MIRRSILSSNALMNLRVRRQQHVICCYVHRRGYGMWFADRKNKPTGALYLVRVRLK